MVTLPLLILFLRSDVQVGSGHAQKQTSVNLLQGAVIQAAVKAVLTPHKLPGGIES